MSREDYGSIKVTRRQKEIWYGDSERQIERHVQEEATPAPDHMQT